MQNRPANTTQSVANNSFLTKGDLEANFGRFRKAKKSLHAAKKLSEQTESLAMMATQAFLSGDGGAALTHPQQVNFAGEISGLLRIVEYCLVVGSTGPIDDFLPGRLERYRASAEPVRWYVAALNCLKEIHDLHSTEASEANFYIDYLISNMS